MSISTLESQRTIVVVGAGWYGCHIAMELCKAGHRVTLIERRKQITSQCSGNFGIRLHRGPHYPRSPRTREDCRANFDRFIETYPELIHWHDESIYAYSSSHDAQGLPPKVSLSRFESVCFETEEARRLDNAETTRFRHIAAAYDLEEPSIVIGSELRKSLGERLARLDMEILLGVEVREACQKATGVSVILKDDSNKTTTTIEADFVINATGYQSLVTPDSQPEGFEAVYQVCIAFDYQDKQPGPRPFSIIMMDGWYPCLMPVIDTVDNLEQPRIFKDYILTHGSYTILGSFGKIHHAQALLKELSLPSSSPVLDCLRKAAEFEMCRFWPAFKSRFEYRGWHGTVLAKPRTHCEFRSSLVFAKDRLIHIMPGKVSNIFNAYDEVASLIRVTGTVNPDHRLLIDKDGWQFIKGGALDQARHELGAGNKGQGLRTTDSLQTWRQYLDIIKGIPNQ